MHRTLGDGYGTDPIGGQRIYQDENPPINDATQLRYQEMNAIQEELCNAITAAGISLNGGGETIQQMTQLRDAIDALLTIESGLRVAGDVALGTRIDDLNSTEIANDSLIVGGANLTEAIDTLSGIITALTSSNISNVSGVTGANVTIALDTLAASILALASNQIADTSSVPGPTVADALNTIWGILATLTDAMIGNTSDVGGSSVRDALNNLLIAIDSNTSQIATNTSNIAGLSSGWTSLSLVAASVYESGTAFPGFANNGNLGGSCNIYARLLGNYLEMKFKGDVTFTGTRFSIIIDFTNRLILDNASFFGSYNRCDIGGGLGIYKKGSPIEAIAGLVLPMNSDQQIMLIGHNSVTLNAVGYEFFFSLAGRLYTV